MSVQQFNWKFYFYSKNIWGSDTTLFFIRTILQEYRGSNSQKIKNKLRKIPASELMAQGKI